MPRRRLLIAAMVLVIAGAVGGDALPPAASAAAAAQTANPPRDGWSWPVWPFRLERPYVQPAHEYGPGHRGIDLRPLEDRDARSPADGTVAFVGSVAGRPLITIDHGDGFVTTLEPVDSDLEPGASVAGGDIVGTVAVGGHAAPGALHFGVRLAGEYINPLLLLGGVPRAVLLPCCG